MRSPRELISPETLPKVYNLLAFVGVPVVVVLATGGIHTVGFWVTALIWIPLSMLLAAQVGIMALLVASPLLFLLDKVLRRRFNRIMEYVTSVGWVCFGVAGYVTSVDLGDVADIRLLTPWPNVGALVVIAGAGACSWGLLELGGRARARIAPPIRPLPINRYPTYHRTTPEPEDVFWSDEPVTAWRSWTWDGENLKGVWNVWTSEVFEADCDTCQEVPAWDHTCGVYAVKSPHQVFQFAHRGPIIGRVEMWGDVIEHEHGYRASNARIVELWVMSSHLADEIADRYRVTVHWGLPNEREVASRG